MTDIKLSDKLQKIVKEIESLTVIEMADLASYLEKKFGIAAVPMAVSSSAPATAVAGGAAPDGADKEEKTTFTVVLSAAGEKKLDVIRVVREILPNLGLMEAKKLVESTPKELLTNVKKNQAEEAKKKIETAGGKVELK